MKLSKVDLFPIEVECVHPGPVRPDIRSHVVLRLTTSDGHTGWGEITGYPLRSPLQASLQDLQRFFDDLLIGEDPRQINRIHGELTQRLIGTGRASQIACGVDLALHDLVGKWLNVPVSTLLGGTVRDDIPVAYPIPAHVRIEDVPASVAYMGEMLQRGFSLVRFYIGLNLEADALCLSQMRQAYGDQVTIKTLDCNCHMDWKTARAAIHRFQDYGFMLVESPARRGDLSGLAEVRRSINAPVSEHAFTLTDAYNLVKAGAVDVINLTTIGAGGIGPARKLATMAEAGGVKCVLGGAHELSLGAAGEIHLGLTLPGLGFPIDSIGPEIYASDVVREPLPYRNGRVSVSPQPGLGLEVDLQALQRHAPAEANAVSG